MPLSYPGKKINSGRLEKFSFEEFDERKALFEALKQESKNYSEIKARDCCDLASALVNLHQSLPVEGFENKRNEQFNFVNRELKNLAVLCAKQMKIMQPKSREIVRDVFAKIDFYEPTLTDALKKFSLVESRK